MTSQRKTFAALLGASLAAIVLDCARGGILGASGLGYLVWNLFLAWIPFLISALLIKKGSSLGRFLVLGALWLLFFPNAPYMVTDVIHIASSLHHLWYDSLVFFFFGWIALLLGILSLRDMHARLRERMRPWAAELVILAISLLASFGIYLGRFDRWNSWDLFVHPSALILHSYALGTGLGQNATPLLFTFVFAAFIYTTYKTLSTVLA